MKSLRKILEALVTDSVALYAKIDEYEFMEDTDGIRFCVDKLEELCNDSIIQINEVFNMKNTDMQPDYLTGAQYLDILNEKLKIKMYDYTNDDTVIPY